NKLPQVHLSGAGHIKPELFLSETGSPHHGMRFKWIVSTCIAGVVGLCAIGSVMYTSMNLDDGSGVVTSIKRAGIAAMEPFEPAKVSNGVLRVAARKTDLIQGTSKGLSTRHIIHDTVVQKRGEREFINIQPYARIVARLSTVQSENKEKIPPFNPFKLYANTAPLDVSSELKPGVTRDVTVNVLELLGGIIPNEDGQELGISEISQLISEADDGNVLASVRPAVFDEGEVLPETETETKREETPPKTTIIYKTADPLDILDQHEVKVVKVKRGDTLQKVMKSIKAEPQQAKAISTTVAFNTKLDGLKRGQELRFALSPSPSDADLQDPVAMSVFSKDKHLWTISRNESGEYVVSDKPTRLTITTELLNKVETPHQSTIYNSIFHAGIAQSIAQDQITRILRIFAYDVDFKKRSQIGDQLEVFYDLKKEESDQDGTLGELLYTSMNVQGETRSFYRFRTPDGVVDYFDNKGSSSKKFLMRKPVRGARFTSGFGMRYHPISKVRKLHRGVDWAAKRGTPILAAGNGTIETAKRRRGFGNYIRIRHANGYKTAYGHMWKFAKGIQPGVKIRQGQVIGYVGSTGASTGNHLHYEVLVNARHVNPMKIEVPRGRVLEGRLLAEFHKERKRIDDLMRRSPVKTRVAEFSE
ncbi:MAG: M23 family metallopeptidase, partial [Methyloligellaceae bacterium]